ncbi:TIGR01244 family protein [Halomonas aestuarii]|uniref:TIGR01244 family protein n=1 Tax=Halomonas aestuarii TaxID=1897729 RepID=A0A1J0VDL7_9GAMM|nr:TIGR01244 family sulfur transferase [Halomonas aestuarii]APE30124.1 TIGR01244 family protein [Halomonas aestuarii]
MQIHELEAGFAIADAVTPADLDEVARRGFRSVICNRRPGEAEDHPDDRPLRARAAELGLEWRSIPVTPGDYAETDIEAFGQALEEMPAPILAFCRTGKRAVHLWAQARSREAGCNIAALLAAAHDAGHDPQPIREMLKA